MKIFMKLFDVLIDFLCDRPEVKHQLTANGYALGSYVFEYAKYTDSRNK